MLQSLCKKLESFINVCQLQFNVKDSVFEAHFCLTQGLTFWYVIHYFVLSSTVWFRSTVRFRNTVRFRSTYWTFSFGSSILKPNFDLILTKVQFLRQFNPFFHCNVLILLVENFHLLLKSKFYEYRLTLSCYVKKWQNIL